MKKLISIMLTAVLFISLSSCGVDEKPAVAVSNAAIYYGVSSYAFFTEDEVIVKELAKFYNSLKLKRTDEKLDLGSAYHIYLGDKSFWIDENSTVWLNGSTTDYKLSSGKAVYERIAEIYEDSKNSESEINSPYYPEPELEIASSDEKSATYIGGKNDLEAFAATLASAGWDKYDGDTDFAFYKDSVILLASLNESGTEFSVTHYVGEINRPGTLTEEDAKFAIGESISFTIEIYVHNLYEKLGLQLFLTVLRDRSFKQNLISKTSALEIPGNAQLYAVADTDDDGEYEFVCAAPDDSSETPSYVFSTYISANEITRRHIGRYAPETLTPLSLSDDGSGRLLMLLTDAHGMTVKRTVSFLNDKISVS